MLSTVGSFWQASLTMVRSNVKLTQISSLQSRIDSESSDFFFNMTQMRE